MDFKDERFLDGGLEDFGGEEAFGGANLNVNLDCALGYIVSFVCFGIHMAFVFEFCFMGLCSLLDLTCIWIEFFFGLECVSDGTW